MIKFEKEQSNDLMNSCQKEIRKLKKQLEEYKKENEKLGKDKLEYLTEYTTMLTLQDKFIKYLEDEIKDTKIKWSNKLTDKGYLDIAMTVNAYERILQKYKEIIGDDKK